jgi:hypothetical protein
LWLGAKRVASKLAPFRNWPIMVTASLTATLLFFSAAGLASTLSQERFGCGADFSEFADEIPASSIMWKKDRRAHQQAYYEWVGAPRPSRTTSMPTRQTSSWNS